VAASDNNNTIENKQRTKNLIGNANKRLTLATTGSNFETSNLYSERNLEGNKKKMLQIDKTD